LNLPPAAPGFDFDKSSWNFCGKKGHEAVAGRETKMTQLSSLWLCSLGNPGYGGGMMEKLDENETNPAESRRRRWWVFPCFHAVALLVMATGLRVGLMVAFCPEGMGLEEMGKTLAMGLWLDVVVALAVVAPLAIWCAFRRRPWVGQARWWLVGVVGLGWVVQAFLFISEGFFFDEFLSRFNTVAIDYLIYPTEVVTNLWESYPLVQIVLACVGLGMLMTWASLRWAGPVVAPVAGRWRRVLVWPVAALVMAVPVFLLDIKFSKERIVNELGSNGAVSGLSAALTRNLPYDVFYRTLPRDEAYRLARELLGKNGGEFTSPPAPPVPAAGPGEAWFDAARASLQRRIPGDVTKPRLNVCVLLEEALGSEFFGSLGRVKKNGKPDTLTPRMDQLINEEGMVFERLFADGNRTIRGFEGVFSSFPPLPGDSILARDRTENVETLARVLKRDEYQTLFLYGGRGTFDFIKSYTVPNGWDRLIEQKDFENPVFTTAWGVCNEDLYARGISEMRALHATGKPFLVSFMSVSNHLPFTYPTGRIAEDPEAHSRKHAVKYTDWALGDFFEKVKKEPYWKDTIFVVVADHGARVYGSQAIPLKSYEIPMVVLGPAVVPEPRRIPELGCQLDVAPTILGLLGRPYDSMFFGRDLLKPGTGPGRVLMHHNRSIGVFEPGRLVVFGLNQQVTGYSSGSLKSDDLVPMEVLDAAGEAISRNGQALFRVADDLYLQRRYRVKPPVQEVAPTAVTGPSGP
jgi:phosphoglycerol transferase MdoB-like AlkP superfamily enzyme